MASQPIVPRPPMQGMGHKFHARVLWAPASAVGDGVIA